MFETATYIPKDIAEKIKSASVLGEVVRDFTELKRSGSSLEGECPYCHAKKFTVTPTKSVYKCFSGCEKSGKDGVKFLTDVIGKSYIEALLYLADRYNIPIDQPKEKKRRGNRKSSFRDEQLRNSGIPDKYQKYALMIDSTTKELDHDRYQKATIDKHWNVVPGDDMVLHYLDLDGQPMTYRTERGKDKPLVRVRWANPAIHKDKDGNPVKYKSPYKSGSYLWLPNHIIQAYRGGEIIETLYICEGEKKADKMCLEGLPAVAVMGIHNFSASGEMPHHFEMLIKRCGVANVVFMLDSDWQNISIKPGKPVDQRPRTFYKAVSTFKDYFYAYSQVGIELEIYFAYGKDVVHKGIDDMLVYELKGKEAELKMDLEKALVSRTGEGEYVNVHKITDISTYRLKEFWHLHSTPAFLENHKEQLKGLREFTIAGLLRKYDPETEKFELVQKVLPHEQYWKIDKWTDRNERERMKIEFCYQHCLNFLYNRGYGLFEYQENQFRFIHVENRVAKETSPHKIRRFMMDFTREIQEKEVVELLLRGGKQYLGPDNLSNLGYRNLQFNHSGKEVMYLYFRNCFWKITKDEITQRPLAELPAYVWEDKIIPFEPDLVEPLARVDRKNDQWAIQFGEDYRKCDMAQFYERSSSFHWRKTQELVEDETGRKEWVSMEQPIKPTKDELKFWIDNLICKMLAAGYILHDYLDYGNMKAIVAMDGIETEVGRSQGGTGKSIWGKQFEHLVPIEIIDGKKKNIEDDNHLYENVDERTNVIIYDDVRVNFNFEFLFSQITTGVVINPKGEKRYKIKPPKFIVITNHALNGEGNSFDRRQYAISFSDYYNQYRTVRDDFGHQLFHEWDYEQYNLFYNWMATCIQTYLKFGLDYQVPGDILGRRKLRQQIGEGFLSWASLVFDTDLDHFGEPIGIFLNRKLEKVYLMEKYLDQDKKARRYMNEKTFKEKVIKYAEYSGLSFNPTKNGGRIKSNGKEYFILADEKFNAKSMAKTSINNDDDLAKDIREGSGNLLDG